MKKSYFHVFANGGETDGFICSEEDFRAAFNRVGISAYISDVTILAFSIEETHPHFLIFADKEHCIEFSKSYERSTTQYIIASRGPNNGVNLKLSMYEIEAEDYLMNVASYVIVQPTKDGKRIMPYEYLWGTASLYFRANLKILPWYYDADGNRQMETSISELSFPERWSILKTRKEIPGEWKICNRILLPTNYVDIGRYEAIFKTHNCFRTFMSSGRRQDEPIMLQMSKVQSPTMDDLEARRICNDTSLSLFGHSSLSKLSVQERISLAQVMRHDSGISVRQLSSLLHIPVPELKKFIH